MLVVIQLVKKLIVFYGTQRFIVMLVHATGPYIDPEESSPHVHTWGDSL
jgi:hypothetical protein